MHPNDLIRIGEQHLDELRADADRRRLTRLVRNGTRRHGPDDC